MATGWRRRGTGPYDSRPGLRAKTRRSGPACYRKGSLPAAGWRKKNTGEALLTQNRKHYPTKFESNHISRLRVGPERARVTEHGLSPLLSQRVLACLPRHGEVPVRQPFAILGFL